MGKKKTERIVFENVKILDAGAKGVSVAKAPDGKVIFLPNVVPGDVVDVQTIRGTEMEWWLQMEMFQNILLIIQMQGFMRWK